MMAANLEWVDGRLRDRIAAVLEDYASDLFGFFGEDDRVLEAGLARLDSAHHLRPLGPQAQLLRARILASLGRFDEARQALHRLAEQRPRDAHVLAELASMLEDVGRTGEALSAYQGAADALGPAEPGAEYVILGYVACLADAGRQSDARRVCASWLRRLARARKPRRALERWSRGQVG
jgi:predicted Zn-dependent protease